MTHGVSVVIPAYNASKTIKTTLQALRDQDFDGPLETLIIDDGSTDMTGEICRALGFKVVRNHSNTGLAASLNRGIQLTRNDVVVTLHADMVPTSRSWLKRLVESLSLPYAGAACSLQWPPDLKVARLSLWETLLWGKLQPHYALNNKADAYWRDVLSAVGPFDAIRFRTAGEDEDMALRLRRHGIKVVGSSAEIIHNHVFGTNSKSKTLRKILEKEYSYGRGGGTLRRKFPRHRPGAYVYPVPKSAFYDGLVRVAVCLGVFAPIMVVGLSFRGAKTTGLNTGHKTMSAYPVLNILRYWAYTLGYAFGFVSGSQR